MNQQTHRQALPKGYMLQEYQIDRVLGAGGFGLTYLGWDTRLDQPVAIKEYLPNDLAVREADHSVLPKSGGDEESFRWGLDRFLDEARTLARFKHPNIVSVYRHIEAHGTAYIVMEFVEGETLGDYLKRAGRPKESVLRAVLTALLDGLSEVHRAGFMHRDIKPGNIILNAKGAPVLVDFGSARQAIGSRSRSITSVVTPGYAPIEQYSSRGNQGPWTDIYALGAVMYKAVTGEAPPDATERMRDDPMLPAVEAADGKYSAAFLAAVDWALAVDEDKRPQDVPAWRRALSGEAAPADAAGRGEAGESVPGGGGSGKSRRGVRITAVVAVLAAVVAAAWLGFDHYQRRGSMAEAARQAAAEADRQAAEREAAEARREAERLAREEEARQAAAEADREAAEARREAERLAREEEARQAAEREAAEARKEAERLAREEDARQAAAKAARQAAEREAAEARRDAERLAREEDARQAAAKAARQAAEREAAEARREAERLAREEEARQAAAEADRQAAEREAAEARKEAERLAREDEARQAAEREAAEARREAERLAREEAARQAAAAVRQEAERRIEAARQEAAREAARQIEAARQEAERRIEAARQEAAREAARRIEAARQKAEREAAEAAKKEAARQKAEREAAEAAKKEAARYAVGSQFRDCPHCPQMVVVPAGSFMMGSPSSEQGRDDDEGPVHRVTMARPFAVGVYEVTRGEYARFVSATGHPPGDSCWTYEGGEWEERSGRNWRRPGFSQTDRDPVVCVNWGDAQAYTRWLSGETGEEYRLPSESEWEYAARAGTRTARYWGESDSGQCRHANGADQKAKGQYGGWTVVSCNDGHVHTAPVGSYVGNGYGLHDVLGNVWEWTLDCWNGSYAGAPNDGSAWESGDCRRRVLRGGSWSLIPRFLRSADRGGSTTGGRLSDVGFRVARTLTP